MLASHNTLTYLPPRRWWARLLRPFWQCQDRPPSAVCSSVPVGSRYIATPDEGSRPIPHCASAAPVRLDIRVRRDSRGRWWPCHGLIDLGPRSYLTLTALLEAHNIYPRHDLSLRVVLERSANPEADIRHFRDAVAFAQCRGYNIPEAAVKSPWQLLLGPDATPAEDHYHKPLDTALPWWRQLPGLLRAITTTPRAYAKAHPITPDHLTDQTLHYHDFI